MYATMLLSYMIITYNGANSFKFQTGDTTLLVDPLHQRSFKGAIAVLNTRKPSETDAPNNEGDESAPLWIDTQGEYETGGIVIQGWTTGADEDRVHTAYRFTLDTITVVLLGHLRNEIPAQTLTHLRSADILIVPAQGKPFIPIPAIAKIARQIEPSIIIPSLFSSPAVFLKEFGKEASSKKEEKLVIKKKDLTPGAMQIVMLSS